MKAGGGTQLERLAARFPPGFQWGAATSAYQIEGAPDADGKGPSIWDTFCRVPGAVANGDTGDVACDHYRRFEEDADLMAELGLSAYRFSVSWPRVLPDGDSRVNEAGLAFYDRLVDALLERGIRPLVTLYHWDLPQALQGRGGWGSHEVVERFGEYADVVARRLGDRVTDWITLNEPGVVAWVGHLHGRHAPGARDAGLAVRVAHHLLLAHRAGADALRAAVGDARVGIAVDLRPIFAADPTEADDAAARRLDALNNRWFLDPLHGRGYPEELVAWWGELAPPALDGYDGELDFVGVNYYTRAFARAGGGPLGLEEVARPEAERTGMGWEVYPEGLRDLLLRLHADYSPKQLLVTENGAAFDEDGPRRAYLERHLRAAADALEAGAPLEGYFVWSLLDNFEWAEGYAKRFGIVEVDFDTQRRTIRPSGRWYAELIEAWRRVTAST